MTSSPPAMFHISDVLSITTGRALSSLRHKPALPDGIEKPDREGRFYGILDILEYVSGEDLGRGKRDNAKLEHLLEVSAKVKPAIKKALWYLTDIEYPQGLDTEEKVDAWVARQAKRYGEYLPVYTLEQYNNPNIDTSPQAAGLAAKHAKRNILQPDGTSFGKSVH